MQNLSLPAAQNAPLKNVSDAANKNNTGADKTASGEPNTSFQTMLSKQIQTKQAQAKPLSDKQARARQGSSEHVATQQKDKPAAGIAQSDTAAASDNKAGTDIDPTGNSGTEIKFSSKKLLVEKEDTETKPDADANISALATSMLDPVVLAPVIIAPVINATPLVNAQGASSPAVTEADSPLASTVEGATQKQQGMDVLLSNALSQGKNANAQDKDVLGAVGVRDGVDIRNGVGIQDGIDNRNGDMAPGHVRWQDAMLPGAARQTTDSGELASVMSTLNELNAVKDRAGKDVVTPASLQPAVQVNAALSTQQAASANVISAYPGKPGWDQAISQKVVWMVGAGEQSATLTLNPPDLGPLQVVIHVHNDQADATFISDNTEVRQALEDGMSNLRDKMGESGIQLGQANVSSGGQSQQAFQQATQNRLAAQQNNSTSASMVAEVTSSAASAVRVTNGLVDTFA